MTHKIMIALDNSEGAWRAVEYVAQTFGHTPGIEITLLHILPDLPPAFWDEGHILRSKEREARKQQVEQWAEEQEKTWKELLNRAQGRLIAAGIPASSVNGKFKPKQYDIAEDIVDEAKIGGFDTIVMGRRGLGEARALLLGSVTHKVVQYARGCAVTIVE